MHKFSKLKLNILHFCNNIIQFETEIFQLLISGDDVMSVDQSMLAHDGSRDGSVVAEHVVERFVDGYMTL